MKEWTIMVYMAGDNNLSEDMITSISDLRAGISSAVSKANSEESQNSDDNKITFFVEFDSSHPTTRTRRFLFGQEPKTENDGDLLKPTAVLNDGAKSNAEAIEDFVKFGIENYPAEKYALIISGHSDAFQGRTLLLDEKPPGVSTVQKIEEHLGKALNGRTLDILGFDSCVMNTLEVIYEFRNVTKYWLGSQGSIPNYTWDYREIGKALAEKTSDFEEKDIIKVFVEKTRDFNHKYSFSGRAIDISGFDMNFFNDRFTSALENFTGVLFISVLSQFVEMYSSGNESDLDFSHFPILRMLVLTHWKCQTYMHDQSVDLRDFCECLRESCHQIRNETNSFAKSLDNLSDEANSLIEISNLISDQCDAVIGELDGLYTKGASVGADYRYSNGVSLFFPWSFLAYSMSEKQYEQLKFISSTDIGISWRLFILFFSVLTQRPKPIIPTDVIKIFMDVFSQMPLLNFQENKDSVKTAFDKQVLTTLINTLFEGVGGFRDDPKRTRGLDDDYAYYFRRMKNIRSREVDLEDKRDFGKP